MNIKFLKEDGENFEVGDTVTIETTVETKSPFDEERTKANIDDIGITIIGYNDNVVIDAQSMTNEGTGEYFYNWNTENVEPGDYEITVEAEGSGSTEVENDWIRITD